MNRNGCAVASLLLSLSVACTDGNDGKDGRPNSDGSGDDSGANGRVDGGSNGTGDSGGSGRGDSGTDGPRVAQYPELWYSVANLLVRLSLDPKTGNVAFVETNTLKGDVVTGQNAITMLDDGTLLLMRDKPSSTVFHIADVPRGVSGGAVTASPLGALEGNLLIEGLYTDCDGRVYAMDSGKDVTSAAGNRLLRFTGDVLAGDLAFVVVSDLSMASVADIDDMGPAIVNNEIVDNPGLAIDTGTIYAFNFETGFGTQAGKGGSWGIHALGGSLFDDGNARLYVLDSEAKLYRQNPVTFELSEPLVQGPENAGMFRGWSGLAGPLTSCKTGFTVL